MQLKDSKLTHPLCSTETLQTPNDSPTSYHIHHNLDLLELALKHSVEWSLSNRPNKEAAAPLDSGEPELETEAHVRAFVSRFKIELNQLISQTVQTFSPSSSSSSTSEANTSIERHFSFKDEDEDERDSSMSFSDHGGGHPRRRGPSIKLNGKYAGEYRIHEDGQATTTDDERPPPVGGHSSNAQIDDGYRSLSRDSTHASLPPVVRSAGPLKRHHLRASSSSTMPLFERQAIKLLLQQLNDIKARVIDLVYELDQAALERPANSAPLDDDELEAYRRRRDALVAKLDQLIESHKMACTPNTTLTTGGSSASGSSNSVTSSEDESPAARPKTARGLASREGKLQVIDYDFNRRANDLSEMKRAAGDVHGERPPLTAATSSHDLRSQDALVGTDKSLMTRIDVVSQPVSTTMIDFNSMMRDYEERRRKLEASQPAAYDGSPNVANSNHQPSHSSASIRSSLSSHSSGSSSSFI